MKRLPAGKSVLKDVPSPDVTVCVKVATFSQHTGCPCVIDALFGEKLSEPVALMFAEAPPVPHDWAGALELLQATATSKSVATPRPTWYAPSSSPMWVTRRTIPEPTMLFNSSDRTAAMTVITVAVRNGDVAPPPPRAAATGSTGPESPRASARLRSPCRPPSAPRSVS